VEPGTGLTILGTAVGGAKLIEKMLGPTADYVGIGIKNWTEQRVQNVGRIFRKAAQKLGSRIDSQGGIPPKTLKEILDGGSYADDELTAEYFGGILASGRTPNGRDDRGASYLRLTSELSTYQIRFHYITYNKFRHFFRGASLRPTFGEDLEKMVMFWPYITLAIAMDFTPQEQAYDILQHCTSGLHRHDIIQSWAWGRPEHLNEVGKQWHGQRWVDVEHPGILVSPTQFGIDYYLWATGCGAITRAAFLTEEFQILSPPQIVIPDGMKPALRIASPE
jgi:hypothetical protein